MSRRLAVPGLVLVCACTLALAACGKTDATQPSYTIPGSAVSTTTTGVPTCEPATPVVPAEGKPTVTVPTGDAPTTLQTNDIKVGDGATAQDGDTVKMQYVGVSKTTGQEFDSSWSRNAEPFSFTLGPTAQVIKGWNQGIAGMKVGGRRELIIPPDLGYGASGKGEKIPPNDTLVFVVDLVQVCSPRLSGTTVPATAAPGTDVVPTSQPTNGVTTVPATDVVPTSQPTGSATTTATTVATTTTPTTAK